jgi:hypothetical protein
MVDGFLPATQAAESFFAAIPHAIKPETLAEYGVEASREAAQQVTRELLLLNLFWIHSATHVALSPKDARRVMTSLRECIRRHWDTTLGLVGHDVESFMTAIENRRLAYEQIVREGGSPIAVSTELSSQLANASALRDEDRPKLLALAIDLVPVDELGELAAEMAIQAEA